MFGEGLTDFLALGIVSSVPVLAVPGANVAATAVGAWAAGRVVLLATDGDEPGEHAAERTAERIHEIGGRPLRLRWPSGLKDANDVLVAFGPEWLEEFLSRIVSRELA